MKGTGKSLLVLTALRFTPEYGSAALRSALERDEDVVLCLVVDRGISKAVSEQLVETGFVGEKLMQDLRDVMLTEYRERGGGHLQALAAEAASLGIHAEQVTVEGPFVDSVLEVSSEHSVSRILVARLQPPHLSKFVFGGEIDRLIKKASCPVDVFHWSGSPVA